MNVKRRASSSAAAREKKMYGHEQEAEFSKLINGTILKGTQKADVLDVNGNKYSVKSGKKWQIFLYSYNRISSSERLKVLKKCLDDFPESSEKYFIDRAKCLLYKAKYIEEKGRLAAKNLCNNELNKLVGEDNVYIKSKDSLKVNTNLVCESLKNNSIRRDFLEEAIFNNEEVDYFVIKDENDIFHIFEKEEVLNVLSKNTSPKNSKAGNCLEDYNVEGQKILLVYKTQLSKEKNLIEIEIRNDGPRHYREIRFNMYSKDTLLILTRNIKPSVKFLQRITAYGKSIDELKVFIK